MMMNLTVTLHPGPRTTRLLATWGPDDCLRAVLPSRPSHPRAPVDLLESLASWIGQPAHAAIVVDGKAPAFFVENLCGGGLLPGDTARVRFTLASARRPRRLRGPGDFRSLYSLHGRVR